MHGRIQPVSRRADKYGLLLLAVAVTLLGVELKYYTHMISGLAGTILLAAGAMVLLQGPRRIAPALAIATSLALGIITVFLGFLGMQARKRTRVMGVETMIGETGVARTDLNPQGTVLIRGEYWQATSENVIPEGKRVAVERIKDLLLYVKET